LLLSTSVVGGSCVAAVVVLMTKFVFNSKRSVERLLEIFLKAIWKRKEKWINIKLIDLSVIWFGIMSCKYLKQVCIASEKTNYCVPDKIGK
jgi:hypothetical protein